MRRVLQRTIVAVSVCVLGANLDLTRRNLTEANATPGAEVPAKARLGPPPAQTMIDPIPGYPETGEDAWRAKNDRIFLDAVNRYNSGNGYRPGDPGYWTADMLKAQAMLESGRDMRAFATDPLQVNNPADWFDDKHRILGLTKGQAMTPQVSARAALAWLQYKGWRHNASGRPDRYLGDRVALGGYSGNDLPRRSGPVLLKPGVPAQLLASMKLQGFDSATDPYDPSSHTGTWMGYVGLVRDGKASYKVYRYQHYTAHGIHGTVVMTANDKYLGTYWLDAEPTQARGADIWFKAEKSDGNRIHFGPGGPPARAWVGGEVAYFGRPERP